MQASRRKATVVHVDPEVHESLKRECKRLGIRMKDLVGLWAQQWLALSDWDKPNSEVSAVPRGIGPVPRREPSLDAR